MAIRFLANLYDRLGHLQIADSPFGAYDLVMQDKVYYAATNILNFPTATESALALIENNSTQNMNVPLVRQRQSAEGGSNRTTFRLYFNVTGGTILSQTPATIRSARSGGSPPTGLVFRIGADGITQTGGILLQQLAFRNDTFSIDLEATLVIEPGGNYCVTVEPDSGPSVNASSTTTFGFVN